MPVIDIAKDVDHRTLTITAEFGAPLERVWAMYADPRQLEKVWGPPGMPATFVDHDLSAGGRSTYYMTDAVGRKYGGWWQITKVDEPHGFSFDEGFADADLVPDVDLPVTHNVYSFTPTATGTRATYVVSFASAEDMQTVLDLGTATGLQAAINQIDEFLERKRPCAR